MSTPRHCPRCGRFNTDNWPLDVGGTITDGGCQLCVMTTKEDYDAAGLQSTQGC